MTAPSRPLLVVAGVSGSGKSTIGALAADLLGVPFRDADDLHPEANRAKMASGVPLTDDDRWPWLRAVGAELAAAPDGLVVACSTLRRAYRDLVVETAPGVRFALLDVDRDVLAARLGDRPGHFMPASLLDSQLATLEPLAADEPGFTVPLTGSAAEVAAGIVERVM